MCGPTKPSAPPAHSSGVGVEDSIHLRDLTSLLSALKKERFLAPLVDIGIDSVGALASTPMEKLSTKKEEGGCGLPKMVARAIGSTAAETAELYEALASKGKTEQYAALVTGDGVERVRTLEELAACPIERLSPPFPRLTLRILQKAARERIESRPLRQFLLSVGKAEKLDALTAIGLKSPENIRDCDAELLSDAVGRMMARILKKRAVEAFPPPPEEPPIDSGPDCGRGPVDGGPAPTFEQLTRHYMPRTSSTRTLLKTVDPEKVVLTLMEKKAYPNDTCVLRFHSSELIEMKAGHFVKLRFSLPNGKSASRFYSVASCPCPVYGDTEELEFLIKEVKGGKVSPYIVGNGMGSMELYDNCELLTVAGGFVLPEPADGTCRLMVSAGVGIVAFMSAVRSVVARVEKGLVKQKIMLSLIHSERKLTFPFLDELLTISKRFSNHDLFTFDLTLCCTGKQEDVRALGKLRRENPWMTVKSERVERELLSSAINKFPEPSELPIFGCGPRGFQKMVRETVLKQLGHKRSLMHLEFFDL